MPVADPRLGEKVCLAVMFHPGQNVEPADILAFLDGQGLSKYDMPEFFIAVDDIPLTASGKIRKRDIAEQIAAGQLQPAAIRWQAKAG